MCAVLANRVFGNVLILEKIIGHFNIYKDNEETEGVLNVACLTKTTANIFKSSSKLRKLVKFCIIAQEAETIDPILSAAIEMGNLRFVRANISRMNNPHVTIVKYIKKAFEKNEMEILNYLIKYGVKQYDSILLLVGSGCIKHDVCDDLMEYIFKLEKERITNVLEQDIYFVVRTGNLAYLKLLVRKFPNFNWNRTALCHTFTHDVDMADRDLVLEYLVKEVKLDYLVKIRNGKGDTLLFHVRRPNMIECLIKLGADINAKNNNNRTALYLVEDLEEAKALVQLGISLNEVDVFGLTAIHYLIVMKKLDIVE